MGMYVIAEGIETQAQADFLSMHECDQFQGYLYARPMPAEEFSKLIPNSHS
jgi:EAL domain-containing protein (putative c-di-GMP-specific phosphodiesterase class I)